MTAKEAKTQSEGNTLRIQIDRLIDYHSKGGGRKIDIGWFGYDMKVNITDENWETLLEGLKADGFKVEKRENSQHLCLAYVISW